MRHLRVLMTPAILMPLLIQSATVAQLKGVLTVQQAVAVVADDKPLGSTMTLEDLQKTSKQATREQDPPVITVQPAAEPEPALKIRFYPYHWELRPGSALLHFSRAQLMYAQLPGEKPALWQSREWLEGEGDGPIPTAQELEKVVLSLEYIYSELHHMALSEDFVFDHRMRDQQGTDVYTYLLPDIQEARTLARILVLKIRYQLSKNDFDGAFSSITDGLRLAEFVGQGESLIVKLIGTAIQNMMRDQITKAISTPGCPNLYWALASIPRPLLNVRESVLWELHNTPQVLPQLAEAETETWTDAEAGKKWASLVDTIAELGVSGIIADDARVALAIASVTFVDSAHKRLVERGVPIERLKKLPGLQIVLLDAAKELRRAGDDLGKTYLLPVAIGNDVMKRENDRFQQWIQQNRMSSMAAIIAGLLYPAGAQVREAELRTQMAYNRLMTLEALRMHAATHGGMLPESLAELSPVPAMPDTYTGEPFGYKLEDIEGTKYVTLTAAGPTNYKPLQVLRVRFEE